MGVITDWGAAIWTSLTSALALAFAFIPKLLGFLVILLIGWIVATSLNRAVTFILKKVGFDNFANRVGLTNLEQRMGVRLDPAATLGKIVYWFVFLIFLVPAVDALGLTTVSNLLGQIVAYVPNVFVAVLVLFLGTLLANFAADMTRGVTASTNIGNPNVFSAITRYAILGFVALIALYQLQIAPAIIQTLFTAIVGALALAFGLAFGLGGRETAQHLLARGEYTLSNASMPSIAEAQEATNEAVENAAPANEPRTPEEVEQLRHRQYRP